MNTSLQTAKDLKIPAILVEGPEGAPLLDMQSMLLSPGKTLAVTGPSGAGKSLFLKSLFGWVRRDSEAPFSPERGAYLMIQDPLQGLTPSLSLGGHFREVFDGSNWKNRAVDLCSRLGLKDPGFLTRKPASFSGGEKQRLMLALVLARDPRVLVCDEPASSLDRENESKLWDLVLEMKQETLTLIFVTHRLDLIKSYADQVLLIDAGRAIFYGSKRQFFAAGEHPLHQKYLSIHGKIEERKEELKPANALIEVRELNLSFAGKQVFTDFSWQAFQARWNWVLGPSGCGKTSLARFLCGLLPLAEGTVRLMGSLLPADLGKRSVEQRRAMQYLFQHGSLSLNPARDVSRELSNAYADQGDTLSQHLERLGLAGHSLNRKPHSFSMGELQRLNLIRALATSPKVLICDEIFSALDLSRRYDMLEFLEQCRRDSGLTLIVITQDRRLQRFHPGSVLDLSQNITTGPRGSDHSGG